MRDNFPNVNNRQRVNSGKRFIEQNERWIGGQRPGNFQPSTFPAGEFVRFLV